jgi:hypothetical protein
MRACPRHGTVTHQPRVFDEADGIAPLEQRGSHRGESGRGLQSADWATEHQPTEQARSAAQRAHAQNTARHQRKQRLQGTVSHTALTVAACPPRPCLTTVCCRCRTNGPHARLSANACRQACRAEQHRAWSGSIALRAPAPCSTHGHGQLRASTIAERVGLALLLGAPRHCVAHPARPAAQRQSAGRYQAGGQASQRPPPRRVRRSADAAHLRGPRRAGAPPRSPRAARAAAGASARQRRSGAPGEE